MRKITYSEAINEAQHQAMEICDDVVILGQLVDYKPGVFGTTKGLVDKFGSDRVRDFPIAENVMTSIGIGLCLAKLRPVLVHQRLDFMMYAMDPITNWMSMWRFKSDKTSNVPVTMRVIIGKGWGQGPQHSKNLHAWFSHLPGLRVAIPSTAFDAKGLLLESIFGENPTIFIENRSLFSMTDDVPKEPYRVKFGEAAIRKKGSDVTIVTHGATVPMALRISKFLEKKSINAEVIDLRTLTPLDSKSILKSAKKTKRLVVIDQAWKSFGSAAEIISIVTESFGLELKTNPIRITLPDSHTPMSYKLEEKYYINELDAINRIQWMFN